MTDSPTPPATGTPAPQTNPAVAQATSILTSIIEDGIVKGLLEPYVVTLWPPLGWPVINQLVDFGLEQEGSYIAMNMSKLLAVGIINIQVADETSALGKSWQQLVQACASGDPSQINSATTQVKNDFNNLVGWDGS